MREKRFGAAEFGLGVVLGLAAGVVVGIMLAPKSGTEIRGQIAGRATDIRWMATELIDQAKHGFDVAATQVEKIIGLQERNLRRKLDEIGSQLEQYHLNEA